MRGAEHHRLQHERDADAQVPAAEVRADRRAERQRNRAEHAFLHESRLQRDGDRRQRRHQRRQDVGIGQRLRRLPPAEPAIGDEVEGRDQRQLDGHEQVAARSAARDLDRAAGVARPHAPQLRVVRKARRVRRSAVMNTKPSSRPPPRKAARDAELADPERAFVLRGRERKPGGRRGGERGQAEQAADDQAGDKRRSPHQPVPAQQPQSPEDAAEHAVENPGSDAGDTGDRVARAAQLLEAALEALGHVHVRIDRGRARRRTRRRAGECAPRRASRRVRTRT